MTDSPRYSPLDEWLAYHVWLPLFRWLRQHGWRTP